jgi:hypothetical protein
MLGANWNRLVDNRETEIVRVAPLIAKKVNVNFVAHNDNDFAEMRIAA